MDKFTNAGFVLFVLLFFEGTQLCFCTNSTSSCVDHELQALLKLRTSFEDPSNRLASWSGRDCCRWKGVSCNEKTGHVVKLDLKARVLVVDEVELRFTMFMAPELNSCLLELKYLDYLDLSRNNFNGSQIPNFLGYMKHLRYLNLSDAGFSGIIPQELGKLTSLQVLDLGRQEQGILSLAKSHHDDFEWLSTLSSLRYLDLSWVDLRNATNLLQVLNVLPSLLQIRLAGCNIDSSYFPQGYENSTFLSKVQVLDLSFNMLSGPIPNILQTMTALRELRLSYNSLNSTIPLWLNNHKSLVHLDLSSNQFDNIEGGLLSMLGNACSLKSLDLSSNALRGEVLGSNKSSSRCIAHDLESLSLSKNEFGVKIPSWFGQLKNLKYLSLESNSLYGPIPSSFGQLSILRELDLSDNMLNGTISHSLGKLSMLSKLDLSFNQLNGPILMSFGQLSFLRELDISDNQLNGPILKSFGQLSFLRKLDLSNNQLSGVIPESLGQLGDLEILDLSSNALEGIFSELHFANLSRLKEFNIGSNHLSCKVKSDWIPPFHLQIINMSYCNFGSPFPRWLQTQRKVFRLDLSNSNISGSFPTWLQGMSLYYLDLSMNNISGSVPMNISRKMPILETLLLSNNLINGSMPNSLCTLEGLRVLDLSRNQLSGEIPDCWRDTHAVEVINLSFNKLSGSIPSSIGQIYPLTWLHLNENALSLELPSALKYCKNLELLDVGENKITGIIPTWIGENLSPLRILRLRNNMFSGIIPSQLCQLSNLQIMDVAQNNLTGGIPHCFHNLTAMTAEKNVSQHDSIPSIDSIAAEPDGIHLARPVDFDQQWRREKATEIMKGLYLEYTTNLQLLDNMDLSSNKLVGIIPEELIELTGLRGLNLSHNHLSGKIPNKIGDMKLLESLDLSNNNLFGTIPKSLAEITSLSHLNLSYNNLSGLIPKGNQLQTLDDPSIYEGNFQLCGTPLENKCAGDDKPVEPPMSIVHGGDEDESERFWFYFVIVLGYGTGFWGAIGTLVLKKNWRVAYFRFADNVKEWILMMIAVKIERLKKKIRRTDSSE